MKNCAFYFHIHECVFEATRSRGGVVTKAVAIAIAETLIKYLPEAGLLIFT